MSITTYQWCNCFHRSADILLETYVWVDKLIRIYSLNKTCERCDLGVDFNIIVCAVFSGYLLTTIVTIYMRMRDFHGNLCPGEKKLVLY